MSLRRTLYLLGGLLPALATPALAQDLALCFATADRVADGKPVGAEEKRLGHEACMRAFTDTSSIMQKSQLQQADADILAGVPKP